MMRLLIGVEIATTALHNSLRLAKGAKPPQIVDILHA
jgi:hypothetical protein